LADLSQRARDLAEVERVILARQFGLGDRFVRGFLDAHDRFADISIRQGRITATARAMTLALNAAAFLALVASAALFASPEGVNLTGLLAALFVLGQTLAAVGQLGALAGRGAEAATAGKRLRTYWDEPSAADRSTDGSADSANISSDSDSEIECVIARDLSFAYAGAEPTLRGIDLELNRGQIAALTAATGAGKSTLGLVLCGILQPSSGEVRMNSPTGPRPATLEPGLAMYVSTKPILIAGSIRDNLFGGDPDDPRVRGILRELRIAGRAADPDTPIIGPSGTGVSSGQGQLIQLARAVLRDPAFIIFDEATSSLDMATERRVQESLMAWCRKRT
jgi:ABC-type multidrug transport system fused ATPase/permease subunit